MISSGIYAVLVLLIIFIILLRLEKIYHQRNVQSIPVRIWVNGTRGKSSVTRLISAGLRAAGKKVIAKTTGTKAKLIMRNDYEIPVTRLGKANIKEQLGIIKMAAKEKPDAVVMECMALRPDLQYTESMKIVQPTAVVITNVRPDHLDVMGPTVKDIAATFINATPQNCPVFTTETEIFDDLDKKIDSRNIKIFYSQATDVSDALMKTFSYIEHKTNVALALDVCEHFGVDEKIAIKGMNQANPDPGVLQKYTIDFEGKSTTFIYAMAANDPQSTYLIWQSVKKDFSEINIMINCRSDRIDRSIQLAEMVAKKMEANKYFLTGTGTDVMKKKMRKIIDTSKIFDIGTKTPNQVYHEIAALVTKGALIFGIGNTVGYGEQLIAELLKHKR